MTGLRLDADRVIKILIHLTDHFLDGRIHEVGHNPDFNVKTVTGPNLDSIKCFMTLRPHDRNKSNKENDPPRTGSGTSHESGVSDTSGLTEVSSSSYGSGGKHKIQNRHVQAKKTGPKKKCSQLGEIGSIVLYAA